MQQVHKKICVLGSANVDTFVYVPHIPVPGETIQADNSMVANGGKGANQAAAAGKLSNSCIFTGQVGEDDEMHSLQKQLKSCNVILQWKILPGIPTGKASIYVDEKSGQNSIVIIGGANTHYAKVLSLPEIYKKSIDDCELLQLQKQVPMKINVLAAKYAKQRNKIVMLDCGGRDDDIPEQLMQNLDYISPNETQLLRIDPKIDFKNPVQQIRTKLISKYPDLKVILKLGTKGSDVITSNLHIHTEVAPKINPQLGKAYKIVDTVGAGDCFTSAFCVKILESDWKDETIWEENFRKALIFGNSAAFLCITKKGAMPSMPERKDVEKIIKKYNLFGKV